MAAGRPDSAVAYFGQAVEGYLSQKMYGAYTTALTGQAFANYYLGDLKAAQEGLEGGLAKLKADVPDSVLLLGELFGLLGPICDARGDYDQALTHALDAYRIRKENAQTSEKGNLLNNIGAIYFSKNDFQQAIHYYEMATETYKEGGMETAAAETAVNLGLVRLRMEQYAAALDILSSATPVLAKEDEPTIRNAYLTGMNNLGLALVETGESERGIEVLNKMLGENPGNRLRAKATTNLGYAYLAAGNSDKAVELLGQALERDSAYLPLHERAKICLHLGLAQAPHTARATFSLGIQLLCREAGIHPDSLHSNGASAIRNKRTLFRLFARRAQGYGPEAQDLAIRDYRNAFFVLDLLRGDLMAPASQRFFSSYATYITEMALFRFLQDPAPSSEQLEFGYEVVERNKSLILLESIRKQQRRQASSEANALLEQERQLRSDRDFYQQRLYVAEQDSDSAKIALYRPYFNERQAQLDETLQELQTSHPALYAPLTASDRAQLSDVEAYAAQNGVAVVEYMLGDSVLVAFFVDADGTRLHAIKGEDFQQVKAATRTLLRLLSDWQAVLEGKPEDLEQYVQAAHFLYEQLLAPGLGQSDSPLLLIPDGLLSYLPFEALLTAPLEAGQSYLDLPYLLRQRETSYLSSGAFLLREKTVRPTEAPRCLAFAPSYGDQDSRALTDRSLPALRGEAVALPGAQQEVRVISEYFEGEYRLGKEATKDEFLAQAGHFPMLHLAMHGVPDPEDANYSSLLFEQSAGSNASPKLFNFEIAGMNLPAELVVLSACETGVGEYADGEGVRSLARGFLEAGARSVVMSLWKLEDEASSKLMGGFYKGLADGKTKRGALRAAKLEYLEGADDLSAHPAFWAACVLIGEGGEVPGTGSGGNVWLWLALGGTLVLLIGGGIWMRRGKKRQ